MHSNAYKNLAQSADAIDMTVIAFGVEDPEMHSPNMPVASYTRGMCIMLTATNRYHIGAFNINNDVCDVDTRGPYEYAACIDMLTEYMMDNAS